MLPKISSFTAEPRLKLWLRERRSLSDLIAHSILSFHIYRPNFSLTSALSSLFYFRESSFVSSSSKSGSISAGPQSTTMTTIHTLPIRSRSLTISPPTPLQFLPVAAEEGVQGVEEVVWERKLWMEGRRASRCILGSRRRGM